jgi:DNA-binding XRE family transcriptional regulator
VFQQSSAARTVGVSRAALIAARASTVHRTR